jgi:hypothetical protein
MSNIDASDENTESPSTYGGQAYVEYREKEQKKRQEEQERQKKDMQRFGNESRDQP